MSTTDLDALAERMLWPATRLIAAVHDRDDRASHDVLAGLGTVELRALCVVLAALVPDDQALTTLADWTRGAPPVSERQAAEHRAALEAELADARAARRRVA
ncbi:hypothetical protein [Streptosporangium saharense]|uniref:hypothetical protein n=1 Tax=Streptosporangium saharense TaxID=1706840 RepID=UPI00331EFB1D